MGFCEDLIIGSTILKSGQQNFFCNSLTGWRNQKDMSATDAVRNILLECHIVGIILTAINNGRG